MDNTTTAASTAWFYESDGQRMGPTSEVELAKLIATGRLLQGTPVWTNGFTNWIEVEKTSLQAHFSQLQEPPPLPGTHVNDLLVWVLAFAPLIGMFLEAVLAGVIHGDTAAADIALDDGKFWFVTVALNIVLSYLDEAALRRAGFDTARFKGFVWLVPVYLYQRARFLKQNVAYFVVWLACFAVTLTM